MSASEMAMTEDHIENLEFLLGELYQILGQFQDEIPEQTLDKICAYLEGEYNGKFADEYDDLLPFVRES